MVCEITVGEKKSQFHLETSFFFLIDISDLEGEKNKSSAGTTFMEWKSFRIKSFGSDCKK